MRKIFFFKCVLPLLKEVMSVRRLVGRSRKFLRCAKRPILTFLQSYHHHSFIYSFIQNVHSQIQARPEIDRGFMSGVNWVTKGKMGYQLNSMNSWKILAIVISEGFVCLVFDENGNFQKKYKKQTN